MESFSQRKGIKPVRTEIQRESMDDKLRIGLWNTLYTHCFEITYPSFPMGAYETKEQQELIKNLLINYFYYPIDELKPPYDSIKYIKPRFRPIITHI